MLEVGGSYIFLIKYALNESISSQSLRVARIIFISSGIEIHQVRAFNLPHMPHPGTPNTFLLKSIHSSWATKRKSLIIFPTIFAAWGFFYHSPSQVAPPTTFPWHHHCQDTSWGAASSSVINSGVQLSAKNKISSYRIAVQTFALLCEKNMKRESAGFSLIRKKKWEDILSSSKSVVRRFLRSLIPAHYNQFTVLPRGAEILTKPSWDAFIVGYTLLFIR